MSAGFGNMILRVNKEKGPTDENTSTSSNNNSYNTSYDDKNNESQSSQSSASNLFVKTLVCNIKSASGLRSQAGTDPNANLRNDLLTKTLKKIVIKVNPSIRPFDCCCYYLLLTRLTIYTLKF